VIFSGRKWFTRKFAARRGQISKLLFELSKSRFVDLQTLSSIAIAVEAMATHQQTDLQTKQLS